VTLAEREAARDLLEGDASQINPTRGRKSTAAPRKDARPPAPKRKKLSVEDVAKIKAEIEAADSVEEISRLEKILESGYNL
jgi:hypothetical protein